VSDKEAEILVLECRQCKDTIEIESYFAGSCECGDLMADRSDNDLEIYVSSGQLPIFFYRTNT